MYYINSQKNVFLINIHNKADLEKIIQYNQTQKRGYNFSYLYPYDGIKKYLIADYEDKIFLWGGNTMICPMGIYTNYYSLENSNSISIDKFIELDQKLVNFEIAKKEIYSKRSFLKFVVLKSVEILQILTRDGYTILHHPPQAMKGYSHKYLTIYPLNKTVIDAGILEEENISIDTFLYLYKVEMMEKYSLPFSYFKKYAANATDKGVLYSEDGSDVIESSKTSRDVIKIKDGVIKIKKKAFWNAKDIMGLILPKTLQIIEKDNFFNLKRIYIPKSVKKIFCKSFRGSSLIDVYYEGTQKEWELLWNSSHTEIGFDKHGNDELYHCPNIFYNCKL